MTERHRAFILEQKYGCYPYRFEVYRVQSNGGLIFSYGDDDFNTVEDVAEFLRRKYPTAEIVYPGEIR